MSRSFRQINRRFIGFYSYIIVLQKTIVEDSDTTIAGHALFSRDISTVFIYSNEELYLIEANDMLATVSCRYLSQDIRIFAGYFTYV